MGTDFLSGLSVGFERLIGEVREGITVSDARLPDCPLSYVNRGFENLTGYGADYALGRNCRFLQGPETDMQVVARMRESLAQAKPCAVELLNYRRDGSKFWNSVSITPVFDEQGELQCFIGVQMDVSERRLREQKEREFVDNLSHELKTPLAAQIGIVETLLRQPALAAEHRQNLYERLLGQALRLDQTVEEILRLARVDSGLARTRHGPIDLRVPLRAALDVAEGLASLHELQLSSQLPQDPVSVIGDADEVQMLAGNLLSNAIIYNRPGGTLQLSLAVEGQQAVLRVSDSGIGIEPDQQQRVFERFYRVDPGRSRRRGGSGLGLAIVREIAESQSATVTLNSAVGQGSVFTVSWPLAERRSG